MTTQNSVRYVRRNERVVTHRSIVILMAALVAGYSAHALAQSAPPAHAAKTQHAQNALPILQEVHITGTRIITHGYRQPTPVTSASTNQLLQATPTNIPDALNANLPQFLNSSSPSRSSHNFTTPPTNGNILNLRGVGGGKTLILFDGIRMPPTTFIGQVDVDVLPEMLVKRVDVVTGGASAVYGSGAVAGVVNFVLNKSFSGLKAEAQYGESQLGDNQNYRFGIAGGTSVLGGRGHVLFSLDTYHNHGMLRSDRAASNANYVYVGSTPGTALPGTVANPYVSESNISIPASSATGLMLSGPLAGEQFTPGGTGVEPFNAGTPTGTPGYFRNGQGLIIPADVTANAPLSNDHAFARFSYELTPHIAAHIQGAYSRSQLDYIEEANGFIVPTGATLFSGNPYLPAALQSAFNSTGTSSTLVDIYPFGPSPRTSEVTRFYFINAGLAGRFGSGWRWRANYTHGDSLMNVNQNDTINWQHAFAALDAVQNGSGQTVCNASLSTNPTIVARYANCSPLNLLNPYSTPAGLAYVLGDSAYAAAVTQDQLDVSLSGNLFKLPAGEVGVAVGADYRNEKLDLTSDSNPALLDTAALQSAYYAGLRGVPANLDQFYWLTNTGTANGSVNVKEVFGEMEVPILKDKPLVHSLDLSGAFRFTHYSTSGSVDTWKIGGTWSPVRDVLFRGTLSADIRAPTIYNLDAGPQFGIGQLTDPVTNTTANLQTITTGNPRLQPEKGRTLTFGVVLTPRFLPGLNASIDWYRLDISGAIGTISAQQIVLNCYNSNGSSPDCAFISRPTPTSFPTSVTLAPLNSSYELTEGWDMDAAYDKRIGPGMLTARLYANYLSRFVNPQLGSTQNVAGFIINQTTAYPRVRATLNVGYRVRRNSAFVSEQFISKLSLDAPVPDSIYVSPNVAAVWYTNLTLDHTFDIDGAATDVYLTVNNLFNKQFPIIPGTIPGLNVPTVISLYDTVGRAFTLGVRADLW